MDDQSPGPQQKNEACQSLTRQNHIKHNKSGPKNITEIDYQYH